MLSVLQPEPQAGPDGDALTHQARSVEENKDADELIEPEAPKVIQSKDIISARVEFDDSVGNHHFFTLTKLSDTVQCLVEEDLSHEDFEAPLSVLRDLQNLIDKYDMASKNGYVSTTIGIPSGYGYELTVEYESGEYIRSYDNAFQGFTDEEGDALAAFLRNMPRIEWPTMVVVSEDLSEDGYWDISCTQFEGGSNLSPELMWEPVEGATQYAVFMYCPSLANAMYMRTLGIEETEIPRGYAEEYRGMYHRNGTKKYDLYVYALKGTPDTIPGEFGEINPYLSVVERELDTCDGERGNILARGVLTGRRAGSEK